MKFGNVMSMSILKKIFLFVFICPAFVYASSDCSKFLKNGLDILPSKVIELRKAKVQETDNTIAEFLRSLKGKVSLEQKPVDSYWAGPSMPLPVRTNNYYAGGYASDFGKEAFKFYKEKYEKEPIEIMSRNIFVNITAENSARLLASNEEIKTLAVDIEKTMLELLEASPIHFVKGYQDKTQAINDPEFLYNIKALSADFEAARIKLKKQVKEIFSVLHKLDFSNLGSISYGSFYNVSESEKEAHIKVQENPGELPYTVDWGSYKDWPKNGMPVSKEEVLNQFIAQLKLVYSFSSLVPGKSVDNILTEEFGQLYEEMLLNTKDMLIAGNSSMRDARLGYYNFANVIEKIKDFERELSFLELLPASSLDKIPSKVAALKKQIATFMYSLEMAFFGNSKFPDPLSGFKLRGNSYGI